MRFTEFLSELNTINESLSPEERKAKIQRMKDDYVKYHGKGPLSMSKEEREAAAAKHKAEKPQRRAAADKAHAEHTKRDEETKKNNKAFMDRLNSMSPEERKKSAAETEKTAAAYTGRKGVGPGKSGRRNWTGD